MATIFSKIIKGEIPAYKVAEDDHFFAFLDIHPLSAGHTLVVTKEEVDYVFDLDDALYTRLFQFSRKVARAIEQVVECKRIGMALVGLEIPHAHIHLIPLNSMNDMDFKRPPLQLSEEEFTAIANRIARAFSHT
jgi:histidine triad (HIT) family protein